MCLHILLANNNSAFCKKWEYSSIKILKKNQMYDDFYKPWNIITLFYTIPEGKNTYYYNTRLNILWLTNNQKPAF